MGFTICRTEKLKSFGNIGAAGEHCNRTRLTPNADAELTKYNSRPIGSPDLVGDVKKRILEVQGDKPLRKNGVIAIEQLLSASPELFNMKKTAAGQIRGNVEAWKEFEKSSINWLKDFYGEKNVVAVYVHHDEKSPHIQAFIVPEVNGKMNAKHFLGGREKLSKLQDSFAASVEHLKIDRGIKGSRADHQTLKQFYGRVEQAIETDLAVKLVYNPIKPDISLPLPPIMSGREKYQQEQENAIKVQINEFESGFLQSQEYIKKLASHQIFKPFADEKKKVTDLQENFRNIKKIEELTVYANQRNILVAGIKQAIEDKSFAPIEKAIASDARLKREILNENKGQKITR
jgi:Plasmid recombination enzyme